MPLGMLYFMLEVTLDGAHGAHGATIGQLRAGRGEDPILSGDPEWLAAAEVTARPR